jgi:hypothetical protein
MVKNSRLPPSSDTSFLLPGLSRFNIPTSVRGATLSRATAEGTHLVVRFLQARRPAFLTRKDRTLFICPVRCEYRQPVGQFGILA